MTIVVSGERNVVDTIPRGLDVRQEGWGAKPDLNLRLMWRGWVPHSRSVPYHTNRTELQTSLIRNGQ